VSDGVFSIPLSADLPGAEFEVGAPTGEVATARTKTASPNGTSPKSSSRSDNPRSDNPRGGGPPRQLSIHPFSKDQATVPTGSAAKQSARQTNSAQQVATTSFDFLAGPENRLLQEVVQSLLSMNEFQSTGDATDPSNPTGLASLYNPLLLCGPPGSGKSHVARGLVNAWPATASRRAILTNGADFARQMGEAIEKDSITTWRNTLRSAGLLVLEDLNQLATKRVAQTELLHTIDAILDNGGQLVFTSRLSLDRMTGLPAAMIGRLTSGLVIQMVLPGSAVRAALLGRFAQSRSIELPLNAARALADGMVGTVPELYGALHELHMQSVLDERSITLEQVRRYLQSRNSQLRPTVRSIAVTAAKYFGIKLSDLTGPTRRRAVVQARNVAIFLARQLAGKSLEQLGKFFGGRDHTTVLHSYRTIEEGFRTDPTIRRAVGELRKLLVHA